MGSAINGRSVRQRPLLVVLEPTFRLVGGGDTEASFAADFLFMTNLAPVSLFYVHSEINP